MRRNVPFAPPSPSSLRSAGSKAGWHAAAGAHRHCDRPGRRRRNRRRRHRAGAYHRRRHAQSRGAAAGARRTRHDPHQRDDAESARRTVRTRITGDHELKGFARPVPAWRVRGEAAVASRFAAIRTGGTLPLVGRAHEMGLLLERWRLARAGRGPDRHVIGEAGIGKSRSIEALQEAVAGEPHAPDPSAMFALSQRQRALSGDPAHLPRRRLRRRRLARRAHRQARRVIRAACGADAAAIPLLAELLSIPARVSGAVVADAGAAQGGDHRAPRRRDRGPGRGRAGAPGRWKMRNGSTPPPSN